MISARQTRAEIRTVAAPVAWTLLVLLLGSAALLSADRGAEPYVVYQGVSYSLSSVGGSFALAMNAVVTWWGAILVPLVVAAGWTSHLEYETEGIRRAFEPRRSRRLLASYLAALVITTAGAAMLGCLVFAAASQISAGGSAASPPIAVSTAIALPVMVSFWWLFCALLGAYTRSPATTAVMPIGLCVAFLALSRVESLAILTPTTWLARTTEVGSEGTTLSSLWADGGGILDISWSAAGASFVPLLGCIVLMATLLAVSPRG